MRAGRSYTLRYLNRDGKWIDHSTKVCEVDGELIFEDVPAGAFYFLDSPSDQQHLTRIFLVGEEGGRVWY